MKAIDPVCGMTVDTEKAAASLELDGKKFYFCCGRCAEKFRAEPGKFLAGAPLQIRKPASLVTLGGLSSPTSGKSAPALATAERSAPAKRIEYTCPMHTEIIRDAPGACPVCGMALEERSASAEEAPNPELADMTRRF